MHYYCSIIFIYENCIFGKVSILNISTAKIASCLFANFLANKVELLILDAVLFILYTFYLKIIHLEKKNHLSFQSCYL